MADFKKAQEFVKLAEGGYYLAGRGRGHREGSQRERKVIT